MRIALPHKLGREEVRRRMHSHAHEIGSYLPPGMASVETQWPQEDQMDLFITAAGQQIEGSIDITDETVVIEIDLPAMLGFLRGKLENAVRKQGGKLLE
ncbi:MAG: polyhydroxyalkanoic acid system family protein [Erythrobacter sp.]|uniref:polyhydroxyalkanoic acid system family protein n=1 Tax=Erythrobacter sp. TaxID=1042 RepID=UPI0032679F0F